MSQIAFTRSLLAATALVGLVGVAQAQTTTITNPVTRGADFQTIFGGGSSLAFKAYNQLFGINVTGDNTIGFDWTSKGSGNSQCAFLVNTSVTSPFTGAQSFDPSLPATQDVDIAASDAALTAAQLNLYNNGNTTGATCALSNQANVPQSPNVAYPAAAPALTYGPIVQLPSFGTPITVAYSFTPARGATVKLTDDMLCGIFSGQITTFNDPRLAGSGLPSNGNTINPVVRSDGSGTTFLFLQHLVGNTGAYLPPPAPYPTSVPGVCNASNSNFFAGYTAPAAPNTSTTFANVFANKTLPANFLSASGSGPVQTTLQAGTTRIAYLSPDFTQAAPVNSGKGFPPVAQLLNSNNSVYYAPTASNTALALGTATPPAPGPVTTADPVGNGTLATPQAYVPTVNNPPLGYPIVGYTTLDLTQCYANATKLNGIANFLTALYLDPGYGSTQGGNGFAQITGSLRSAIVNYVINGDGSHTVDLGDPTVCAKFPNARN